MKQIIYVVLAVAFISAALIFMISNANSNDNDIKSTGNFIQIVIGSTETGDVEIALKPLKIEQNKLIVEISANTHSVELKQFDLKELTTLNFNGKLIKPVSAPILNGHHSNGVIEFNTEKEVRKFEIIIEEIPMEEKRSFIWRN